MGPPRYLPTSAMIMHLGTPGDPLLALVIPCLCSQNPVLVAAESEWFTQRRVMIRELGLAPLVVTLNVDLYP
jgi:hypothetical protein